MLDPNQAAASNSFLQNLMQGGKQAQAIDPQQQAAETRKRAMASFHPPAQPLPQGMQGVLQNAGMPPAPPQGMLPEMQATKEVSQIGDQQGQADALQKMLAKFGMPQNPTGEVQSMGGDGPDPMGGAMPTDTPTPMGLPKEMPMTGMGGIQQLGALTGAPGLQQPGPIGQMVASKKPTDQMAAAGKMKAQQPMMKSVS
jgi:hypothetical protein